MRPLKSLHQAGVWALALLLASCANSGSTMVSPNSVSMSSSTLPASLEPEKKRIAAQQRRQRAVTKRIRIPADAPWLFNPVEVTFADLPADVALRLMVPPGLLRVGELTYGVPTVRSASRAKTLLDQITNICAQANWAWRFENGVLVISEYQTRSFDIAATLGRTTALIGSGALGETDDQSNRSVITSNPIEDLERSISSITSGKINAGSVMTNVSIVPSAGQLLVTARPDTLQRVRRVVDEFNERLRRRVQIEFVLYEIDVSNSQERNLNLSAIRNAAVSAGFDFSTLNDVSNGSGQLSLSFNEGNGYDGSRILFNWLQRLGDTEITIRKRIVAQNQSVISLRDVETSRYVSQVSTQRQITGAVDFTSPTVEISELNTGEQWSVIPSIDEDRVYLRLGVSRAQVLGFEEYSFADGAIAGRLPQSATDEIVVPISLRDGETRLITNLSTQLNSGSTTKSPLLSGLLPFLSSKTARDRKIESVVALTVHILK